MYAREKRDSSKGSISHHSDITELFNMLESSDEQTVEDVKSLIYENLTKDLWLLHGLVDFFIAAQSKRALDILVRVREPQDKHLFEKVVVCMKNEATRSNALLLLSHLVYKQPSWLYKITQHRIMNELISILKVEMDSSNLICALLTIVSLLPMFPSQFGQHLSDLFEIFTRLASWSTKKPSVVPEVYVLHLQVGVYNLFLRLYGLFPCNFLAYLRSFYGGRDFNEENLQVFTVTIKPMLERVRLHPLLVTASKESEVSPVRWKKMETHDVLTECAKISLDATDCSNDSSGHYRSSAYGSGISMFATGSSMQDSMQYVSLSSQSSTVSVTLDPGSLVNTSVSSSQEVMWTPTQACGLSTPPMVQPEPVKSTRHLSTQTSVCSEINILDVAQEAKPEQSLKNDVPISQLQSRVHQQDLQNADDEHQVDVAEEAQAVEDREDDVTDKEVSDLTSKRQNQPAEEFRQTTPFCFTTQNLTDEPVAVSKNSEHLQKEPEDDDSEELELSTEAECEIKVENFVKKLNRIRFLSHCGLPPEIAHTSRSVPLHRSLSWPSVHLAEYGHKSSDSKMIPKPLVLKTSLPPSLDQHPQTCGFVSLDSSVQNERMPAHTICSEITPVDHLIPMATSLPVKLSACVTRSCTLFSAEHNSYSRNIDNSFRSSLSPVELLDRHLQLGSETYINQLSFIPLTSMDSTNWTHFGGQPPADEVAILRKQVSMLHSQLLFERHLRETHGARNRRLLGKAKWSRMQQEYAAALKDQVQLNEKENQELRSQLAVQRKLHQQLEKEKQQSESELQDHIRKLKQDNTDLAFTNKKLQGLLVLQKEEHDKLIQEFKESQGELLDIKYELELSHKEITRCRKLKKEATWLTKELVLLQELNQHYKDKLDLMKTPHVPEVEVDLVKDAAHSEITALKQQLESKTSHLDVAKSKISELELLLSNTKLKLAEQKQVIETMRSIHKEEIMARENRILSLCKINQQNEAGILELYHKQEMLDLEIKTLKSHKNSNSSDFMSSAVEFAACSSGMSENTTVPEDLREDTTST